MFVVTIVNNCVIIILQITTMSRIHLVIVGAIFVGTFISIATAHGLSLRELLK